MTPKSVTFELPFLYPSLNQWSKWHGIKVWKAKRKFARAVVYISNSQNIKRIEGPVKIYLDLCFKIRRIRDLDNYAGKWILDSLVQAGIIEGDDTSIIPQAVDIKIIDGEPEDKIVVKIESI